MGKGRGGRGGMRFGMAGGALLTLGESRPRLGESKLFLEELEPINEGLAISFTMEIFLSRRKKKFMDAKGMKNKGRFLSFLITNRSQRKRPDIYEE